MPYQLLVCTLAFIVLDFVSGYINAAIHNQVSSSKLREGLYHKGGYIIAITCAQLLEIASQYANLAQYGVKLQLPLVIITCSYVILTECSSVIENIGQMNPQLRTQLYNIFGLDKLAPKDDNGDGH